MSDPTDHPRGARGTQPLAFDHNSRYQPKPRQPSTSPFELTLILGGVVDFSQVVYHLSFGASVNRQASVSARRPLPGGGLGSF